MKLLNQDFNACGQSMIALQHAVANLEIICLDFENHNLTKGLFGMLPAVSQMKFKYRKIQSLVKQQQATQRVESKHRGKTLETEPMEIRD